MQYKNLDEWLFLKACDEATRACGTFSAQVAFVKQKLERVSTSRLWKIREGNPTLLEQDRAVHYATLLPWNVLEEEVGFAVSFLEKLERGERNFLLSSPSSTGSDEPMED